MLLISWTTSLKTPFTSFAKRNACFGAWTTSRGVRMKPSSSRQIRSASSRSGAICSSSASASMLTICPAAGSTQTGTSIGPGIGWSMKSRSRPAWLRTIAIQFGRRVRTR